MKLVHKKIPAHFLNTIPEGIKYVRKQNQDFLVIEKVCCPNGHDLMIESVRIHHEPTVRLRIKVGKSEGLVFVDAFWGGHAKLYGFIPDVADETQTVTAACPQCSASLMAEDCCSHDNCRCRAAIRLALPGGRNMIYVCARLGCPGHRIEIKDIPRSVSKEVSGINFFGAQSDYMLMEL